MDNVYKSHLYYNYMIFDDAFVPYYLFVHQLSCYISTCPKLGLPVHITGGRAGVTAAMVEPMTLALAVADWSLWPII